MANLPEPARKAGEVVLHTVDRVVEKRWEHALAVASSATGPVEDRVAEITRAFAREMAAVGAAVGATAAVPGAGAVTLVGTTALELGWFTARAGDLILSIAATHGHTSGSVEQRRAWILSVLAFGDTASAGFTRVAGEVGKGLGTRATARIPTETLRAINRALGRTIVTKYGTKRGAIALGRALPFGIGAVIGGSANYAFARAVARQADSFFRLLPPPLDAPSSLLPT
ncbi:MAG: EcsC family protein [Acidimicrobiia bacterium]|nr:EcsC family protein [Acidimicrobiia bacterium]